ncbi:hypothetical protein DXG01_004173 [Tephrocybe rancida]|nr:hypothetical protein DXG01_004173 [Tephrocybe rancida]
MGCILRYICSIPLLFLPSFFASQAQLFLLNAAATQDPPGNDSTVPRDSPSSPETPVKDGDVEMITLPNMPHLTRPESAHISQTSPLPRGWNSPPATTPPLIPSTSPSERLDDVSLKQVEPSWTAYTKRCHKIWLAVASSSGTALAASAPLLQMPGTNGSPVVRALVYLSILRFFVAISSAIVLRYYFKKPGFKSPDFSLLWDRSVKKHHQSPFYMPWTILALPTVAFCWGIIFFIVALFTAVWRTGLSPNPPALEDMDPLALILSRLIISMMTLIDAACLVWLVKVLRRFSKQTKVMPAATQPRVN